MSAAAVEAAPALSSTASQTWSLWSTTATVVVTDPELLGPAVRVVRRHLAAVEAACSRFRPDSELRRIHVAAAGCPSITRVSPLLGRLVSAALDAAHDTDGDVDPTVGTALIRLGYDRDYRLLASSEDRPVLSSAVRPPDWTSVHLDGQRLGLPAGVVLDLGATAKAVAADECAALVHHRLGVGVLVEVGGDLATAGRAPAGGWPVLVQDRDDDPAELILLPAGAALATSSTRNRTWRRGGLTLHHIISPRTGMPVEPVWRSVTVAAGTCVRANTITTAAVVRGEAAPSWVRGLGAPARFVTADGAVRRQGLWP